MIDLEENLPFQVTYIVVVSRELTSLSASLDGVTM
jgi:hypothetical protein